MPCHGCDRRAYFAKRTLDVYLLPRTPWESVHALQQRLVFELSESPRKRGALILCEHPPIVTIGRGGSYRHIRTDAHELATGQVPMRWTNRGGGAWHHTPGQLAVYPVVPLSASEFCLADYRKALYRTILECLQEFKISPTWNQEHGGVWVGDRPIAVVGVAVKEWVAYHGCLVNVCVPVDREPLANALPETERPWTCMFRELRTPVRVDAVREAFLHHFTKTFGFSEYYLSSPPPGSLEPVRKTDVWAAHY